MPVASGESRISRDLEGMSGRRSGVVEPGALKPGWGLSPLIRSLVTRPVLDGRASRTALKRPRLAKGAAQGRYPGAQLFVNLVQLADALQLIDGDAESGQNADQQERQPQLQAPTDGFSEHAVGSGFHAIPLPATRNNEVASQLLAKVEDVHVEQIGQRIVTLVKEMLI